MNQLSVIALITLVAGLIIYALGYAFKIMHWPGGTEGRIAGSIITSFAVILYLISYIRKGKRH